MNSAADLTWFRVGGPAEVLFTPADEDDLARVLSRRRPSDIPVYVIGVGSNLLVRDGGVPGVVIRLGKGFGDVEGARPTIASAPEPRCLDVRVARLALDHRYRRINLSERYTGHDRRRVADEWRGLWRGDQGRAGRSAGPSTGMEQFTCFPMRTCITRYRHCGASEDLIFTEALLQGRPGDPAEISARHG